MSRASRFHLSFWLILIGFILVGALFALDPGLDLSISALFYDPATRTFPLANDGVIVTLRNLNRAVDIAFGIAFGAVILLKLWRPSLPMPVSGRAMLFLSLTFALAPGLAANVIFKENWGRPRPVHVTEFNGPAKFLPWDKPGGECRRNCSFFSGEVSAAAWTLAPAVLVPPPYRAAAIAGAFAFTTVNAFVRISAGGHFFSDTAFALLATALIIWLMYGAIYRGWWREATEEIIEMRMTRFAEKIRRLFGVG
jgi:membrane-associated PAP2 superfamily phosphatase